MGIQQVKFYWSNLLTSLWFIPGVLVVVAIALALVSIEVDTHVLAGKRMVPDLLWSAGPEGSRDMLTAIATSLLTVSVLTFTVTLAAFTQVSNQYSPRVLRNYMNDRTNQVVIGYFIGAFVYCLGVLRTINTSEKSPFVPTLSVFIGLVLAVGGVISLIYFIHHIIESLQASSIIRFIARQTDRAILDFFPTELGLARREATVGEKAGPDEETRASDWTDLVHTEAGYLQMVDGDMLLKWATEHDRVLLLTHRIGDFVAQGLPVLKIRASRENEPVPVPDASEQKKLLRMIKLGRHRTVEQDHAFGIHELVDIALKALSPGVNDTTTALICLDYLSQILLRLLGRQFPDPVRTDGRQVRIITQVVSFEDNLSLALDQIRMSAKGNTVIFLRILKLLQTLKSQTSSPDRLRAIEKHARLTVEWAEQTLETAYEKEKVLAVSRQYHQEPA